MHLPTKQEDPLPIDKDSLLIPSNLQHQSTPHPRTPPTRNAKLTISCNTSLSTKISFVENAVALAAAPPASSDTAPTH